MARPVLHYVSAALLGLLGFGLEGGCSESESMLVIRGVIAMESPECVASPEADLFHLAGSLDTRLTTSYMANLQVANQLMAQGNAEKLRPETARVTITGAEVVLKTPGGSELKGGNYTVTASGSIDPSVADQPGLGVVFAPLVPDVSSYLGSSGDNEDLPNPLIVEVQVFGTTVGGKDVWSNWFTYPVYFTDLVYFPEDSINESTGLCAALGSDEAPCRVGQDDPVPCTACLGEPFCLDPYG